MISFDAKNHCFNLRAAAIFIQENFVLLHRLEGDAIWALPGGRVESGEDAASVVIREMMEEVGEVVQCGHLLYVVENFFEHQSRLNRRSRPVLFRSPEPGVTVALNERFAFWR